MVSEDQIGPHQRSLLQNFYRNDYASQPAVINAASLVRAYARSLLPALWLFVLCSKLGALIDRAAPGLPATDRNALRQGLIQLRDYAASKADPNDHEEYMLDALTIAGRAISLFRKGRVLATGDGIYSPLTDSGLAQSLVDPHLDTDGSVELALAVGLIGYGMQAKDWTCTASNPADGKTGALALKGVSAQSEVFFVASAHAAAQLFAQGHVADNDDAVVFHSFEVPVRAARHPTRAPGRTGKMVLRELSVPSIADGAVSLDTLLKQFKAEMAL